MLQNSNIQGKFNKIMWTSTDGRVVIVSFLVSSNDGLNPVKVNKYNSISVTLKNNLFSEKNITLNSHIYEISVSKNSFSKYPNSYIATDVIEINEDEEYKLNYVIKFLKSSHFPGIGEEKAKLIVKDLGIDALKKMVEDNSIDYSKYSISELTWNYAVEFIKNNPTLIEDQMFFLTNNLTPSLYEIVAKKFEHFKDFIDAYKDNFYLFYLDNERISLEDMDKLHNIFNKFEHPFKPATHLYKSFLKYLYNSGNTRILKDYLYDQLINFASQDTEWPRDVETFNNSVELLVQNKYLIEIEYEDGTYLSAKDVFDMEKYIVKRLKHIESSSNPKFINFMPSEMFHPLQLQAIETALTSKLTLITGNPGTGKTLITNEIIKQLLSVYDEDDLAIVTPTGRATININNIQEKTNAVTIHSFLEWDVDNDKFMINEKNAKPIECLIIDEFSMVSVDLFYSLLKGIKKNSLKRIILVGDKDQLPAIGAGYLIRDFIESNIFQTIVLSKIFRQAENFDIIQDALDINKGKLPEFKGNNSQFIETKQSDLKSMLLFKLNDLLQQGYSKRDIAILSPIYNYETGIDQINETLNNFFRKLDGNEQIKYRDHVLAIDDKVINLVNDPKTKVFNGEIGYISHFGFENKKNSFEKVLASISVEFENDSKTVSYSRKDFFANTYPAYCTSVHKYQGSECKCVIVVLFSEAKKLLSKKLIYTAITRAKKYCVVIGEKEALITGINNDDDSNRITNIKYLWRNE